MYNIIDDKMGEGSENGEITRKSTCLPKEPDMGK